MQTQFFLAATALTVLALLLLLRPWRKPGRDASSVATRQLNTRLYREAWAELEVERASGRLTAAEQLNAQHELERRMLEDIGCDAADGAHAPDGVDSALSGLGRPATLALLVGIPLVAFAMYRAIGTPEALDPARLSADEHSMGSAQIQQMVEALALKLQRQPDNPQGWAMLARSYRAMGRLPDAVKAFEAIGPALMQDAPMLALYADTLGATQGGDLSGKASQLIDRALALAPRDPLALELAATAAHQRGDDGTALSDWQRALQGVPADSDEARWVQARMSELRAGPGAATATDAAPQAQAGGTTGSAEVTPTSASSPANVQPPGNGATDAGAITGQITLAPALASKLRPGDTLYVFARALQGPRMPLAILRVQVSHLPLDFRLDDSLSMVPQLKLSAADRVIVEAHVSHTGEAAPQPGDLIGMSEAIRPGRQALEVRLDQVVPPSATR